MGKRAAAWGTVGIFAFVSIIVGCLYLADDDDACASSVDVVHAQCVPPTDESSASTTVATTPDSAGDVDPTATTIDFAGGAPGTNNTPDGEPAAPPSESDLAPGQQLFQGSSGDQVGFIASDGAFRFLSLEHPGVVVGNEGITSQATTWQTNGTVVGFGARISAATNDGRYGISLFKNGTDYSSGCTLEIGQTSCYFELRGELAAGDSVVIIVGEAGNLAETGDFTFDWWFIFEPAA